VAALLAAAAAAAPATQVALLARVLAARTAPAALVAAQGGIGLYSSPRSNDYQTFHRMAQRWFLRSAPITYPFAGLDFGLCFLEEMPRAVQIWAVHKHNDLQGMGLGYTICELWKECPEMQSKVKLDRKSTASTCRLGTGVADAASSSGDTLEKQKWAVLQKNFPEKVRSFREYQHLVVQVNYFMNHRMMDRIVSWYQARANFYDKNVSISVTREALNVDTGLRSALRALHPAWWQSSLNSGISGISKMVAAAASAWYLHSLGWGSTVSCHLVPHEPALGVYHLGPCLQGWSTLCSHRCRSAWPDPTSVAGDCKSVESVDTQSVAPIDTRL
jgi:hypothetical protein